MKIVKYHISIAVLFSHNHILMVIEDFLLYARAVQISELFSAL